MQLSLPARSLLVLSLLATPALAQQKRVYIAPDDHTDYFWSASETAYRQVFLDTLDWYLDQIDATQANPSDTQARWNCDGSLWLWTYEHNRTPAQFQRLIDRIADGHVSVPQNVLAVCLGAAPAEATLRAGYYMGRMERRTGLRFPLAYAMENQTHPLGLASLWAGSGVKYTWKGICNCATNVVNAWDRQYDMYRQTGPDGASVLTKWNSQLNGNQGLGGYAEARFPSASVDFVTSNAPFNGFAARYPFNVIGAFGKGWDDVQTLTSEFVTTAQTMSNATRRVIVSNELDYFADFESTYPPATSVPSLSLAYGNEWEIDAATLAETSARVKRGLEKLRTAEALAAVVSTFEPAFLSGREAARDLACLDLGLYVEHDFGMWGPPTGATGTQLRIAFQRRLADEIDAYVNTLQADALAALGRHVPASGANPRFFAFNPLSWTRSTYADLAWSDPNPVHVLDVASGLEVPAQIVQGTGPRRLRVWAEGVPAVGYKVFEIVPGAGASFPPAATVTGSVLENALTKVTLAGRGAITSWIDKTQGNREYVRTIGTKAMNDLGPGSGSVTVEDAGPVSVTLLASSSAVLGHTSRVTLVKDSPQVEIQDDLTQNFNAAQFWSFGFEVAGHTARHEEVGAILKAKLSTNGGDYSTRQARYDFLTLNHFVDLSSGANVGATLSNADAWFYNQGSSSANALDESTPQVNVLAGGAIGGPSILNQGGDTHFLQRFALRSHGAYDQAAAMRFALEHQNPLACALVSGTSANLSASGQGFLTLSDPNVLLWSLKPAEDGPFASGGELTARLWNLSENPATTTLQLAPRAIVGASVASHLETLDPTLGPAPIVGAGGATLGFARQQWRTLRLELAAPPCSRSIFGTGKLNSLGCLPELGLGGVPSATNPAPFLVRATNVLDHKTGLLLYGFAPGNTPFQGGTLYISGALKRTPSQSSGGAGSGNCSGELVYDFNARIQGGVDAALVVGASVYCQYIYRDPASSFGWGLSNAGQFTICP